MNIQSELGRYAYLKQQLLASFPDLAEDEGTLLDTLEGMTTLNEALVEVYESALFDELAAEAIAKRIDEMKARKARLEARAERKRQIVADAMGEAGIKKIEAPTVTLSLRAVAPSVIITDEEALPEWALRSVTKTSPDKKAIKDVLADGTPVPGAILSNGGTTLSARTA